jgi:hypothetical protein
MALQRGAWVGTSFQGGNVVGLQTITAENSVAKEYNPNSRFKNMIMVAGHSVYATA